MKPCLLHPRLLRLGWAALLVLTFPPLTAQSAEPPAPPAPAAKVEPPVVQNYWQALKLLRGGKPADWVQARAALKQATDAEYPPALNFVALCHLNKSYGYTKDTARAANFFRLSAEQGNASARLLLGRCYLAGTGVRRDRAQAAAWFTALLASGTDFTVPQPPADFFPPAPSSTGDQAVGTLSGETPADPADQLRASAHLFLGQICTMEGKSVEAQDHFVKAATQGTNHSAGIYEAAIQAAINFAFGQGVPRDLRKANEMLALSKKLARRNVLAITHNMVEQKQVDDFAQADVEEDASAATDKLETELQYAIAGSFADPKSKSYDPKEAAKWYELAAEKNVPWAMLSLAFLHHEGRLGTSDPTMTFAWFQKAAEKGNHSLGWANLSICYERGLGTAADHAKAAELWQKRRDDNIVCYLGTIGQCPATIQTYEQELELTKFWAEKKEDAQAQYLLGLRHLYGWGVKQDAKASVRWLKRAAKANHGRALHELGLLYRNRWQELGFADEAEGAKKAFECFQKSAATGFGNGYFQLGYSYNNGNGCSADTEKALENYRRALALDPTNGSIYNNIGTIFEQRCVDILTPPSENRKIKMVVNGIDVTIDLPVQKGPIAKPDYTAEPFATYHRQMLEAYRKANELKSEYAAYNLGKLAKEGILQPVDLQAAYRHFETAAARDYPAKLIHYLLGQMLEKGEGVPVSLREAAYHYRLAALAGNEKALASICRFYSSKPGFSRDWDRALDWLNLLARRGDDGAIIDIGYVLLQKGDYAAALDLHKRMLDSPSRTLQGFANARLSRMYRDGLGVKPNPDKAREFMAHACELENRDAAFERYLELAASGKTTEAISFLKKACEGGLPRAVYTIGLLHLRGDGVRKDEKFGYGCIKNAASEGIPEAITTLVQATIDHVPGAPSVDAAMAYVAVAEECGFPDATSLREKLAALAPADSAAPAETGAARPL